MKVCSRGRAAWRTACQARSMSLRLARASPATSVRFSRPAIWDTASKSPSEAAGNPASITSIPSFSSWPARRSFSAVFMLAPGLCSPSRRVVSKMITRSSICFSFYLRFSGRRERTAAPARHISEVRMASSSRLSFSR